MRFKLQGRTYTATAVFDRVPLRDLLALEVELETLGRPMKWSQVREMVQRISTLEDAQDDLTSCGSWGCSCGARAGSRARR